MARIAMSRLSANQRTFDRSAWVSSALLARLRVRDCRAADAGRNEERVADLVALLLLDAAEGLLEVLRHRADLAPEHRIGAKPHDRRCEDELAPPRALASDGCMCHRRGDLLAELLVPHERAGHLGGVDGVVLEHLRCRSFVHRYLP